MSLLMMWIMKSILIKNCYFIIYFSHTSILICLTSQSYKIKAHSECLIFTLYFFSLTLWIKLKSIRNIWTYLQCGINICTTFITLCCVIFIFYQLLTYFYKYLIIHNINTIGYSNNILLLNISCLIALNI